MSKGRQSTPRMPATKFANLRKKMKTQSIQSKPAKKK